eukprot:5843664-Prorocentrum_lima.AAC.1
METDGGGERTPKATPRPFVSRSEFEKMTDTQQMWVEDMAKQAALNVILLLPRGDSAMYFRETYQWLQWQLSGDGRINKAGALGNKAYIEVRWQSEVSSVLDKLLSIIQRNGLPVRAF